LYIKKVAIFANDMTTKLRFTDLRGSTKIEDCWFFVIKTSEGNNLLASIYPNYIDCGINQPCLHNYTQLLKLKNFRVKQDGTSTLRHYKTAKGLLKAIL